MTQRSREGWKWKGRVATPATKEGLSVTITAKYGAAGPCDFLSVRHFPKTGVLEYGEYEMEDDDAGADTDD